MRLVKIGILALVIVTAGTDGRARVYSAQGRLLHGGEVGHAPQPEGTAQVGQIVEQRADAAIIRLKEGLEDQTGKQLGLRKEFGAELVRIETQALGADGQGRSGDVQRRFAEGAHRKLDAPAFAEDSKAFLQSSCVLFSFSLQIAIKYYGVDVIWETQYTG